MLLLDTHAFVWLASDPAQLPPTARGAICQEAARLFLSSISALEIGLLIKRGRLELPLSPSEFIARALAHHGIHEIPVDHEIALASTALPDLHNDPFDRILVATAQARNLRLVSKDAQLTRYPGTRVVWS
jgi:PIN domain nuclease of toxin-antitoxin system